MGVLGHWNIGKVLEHLLGSPCGIFYETRETCVGGVLELSPLSPAEMLEIGSNFSLRRCPSRKDVSDMLTNLSSKYREIGQKNKRAMALETRELS